MTRAHALVRAAILSAAVALLLLLGGCASDPMKVEYDYDGSFDFAAAGSWNWVPGKQPEIPDPRVMDSVVDARMRRAIAGEMAAKQMKRTENASPDVWVQYRIWVMPRRDFNPLRESDTRPIPDPPAQDGLDDVGLRIEMFDSFKRSHKIWSAEVRTKLNLRVTEKRREQRTAAAVRRLFAEFPPR